MSPYNTIPHQYKQRSKAALFLPSDGGMAKRPPAPLREPCREMARNAQRLRPGPPVMSTENGYRWRIFQSHPIHQ